MERKRKSLVVVVIVLMILLYLLISVFKSQSLLLNCVQKKKILIFTLYVSVLILHGL